MSCPMQPAPEPAGRHTMAGLGVHMLCCTTCGPAFVSVDLKINARIEQRSLMANPHRRAA